MENDTDGLVVSSGFANNSCTPTNHSKENYTVTLENQHNKRESDSDDSNSNDEEQTALMRTNKKRPQLFNSDSDAESDHKNPLERENNITILSKTASNSPSKPISSDSDENQYEAVFKSAPVKSRLSRMSSSEDSDSESGRLDQSLSSSRIKSKQSKLTQKFAGLVNKKAKNKHKGNDQDKKSKTIEDLESQSFEDESSVEKIKQIIKENSSQQLGMSLYDPDTSDEEDNNRTNREAVKQKKARSIKPISPKPIKMSAKQAMENMQKIKSESNRMLREKEVFLPYHRPKALSLKDIMNRRRPALAADGKALPIKMNEEQLKQYAQQLEQRQKEVIELCKSDTEEDEDIQKTETNNDDSNLVNEPDTAALNDTLYDDLSKTECQVNATVSNKENSENTTPDINDSNLGNEPDTAALNDTLFDDLSKTESQANATVSNKENSENITPKPDTNEGTNGNDVEVAAIVESNMNNNGILNQQMNNFDCEDKSKINTDDQPADKCHNESDNNIGIENSLMEMEVDNSDTGAEISKLNTDKNVSNSENIVNKDVKGKCALINNEIDSQSISLHYDTEKSECNTEKLDHTDNNSKVEAGKDIEKSLNNCNPVRSNEETFADSFSDSEINLNDIDALIENAEIFTSQNNPENINSPMLIKDPLSLTAKPKLTGAPGMVIDLDGSDPLGPKKLSGVELLKERFVYFAKLKNPEELEREKEKRIRPGMQHLKLKQELEEQIAEKRSLEWAKRLEEEKQHQIELKSLRAEESDAEGDIDTIEAKLEIKEVLEEESGSESDEEEDIEQELVDKPRKHNPMIDDEAEESDYEDGDRDNASDENEKDGNEGDDENNADEDESESESSEEESEEEQTNKPKKGRILKAFEDSDDEDTAKVDEKKQGNETNKEIHQTDKGKEIVANNQPIKISQDDELQLAQGTLSEDLFISQESRITNSGKIKHASTLGDSSLEDNEVGTQTFSILESTTKENTVVEFIVPNTLCVPSDSQSHDDGNLDAVVGMCSGSFSQTQNLVRPSQIAEVSESQAIGEDVLALCTGQFYDNQFVSQQDMENIGTSELITNSLNEESTKVDEINKDVNNKISEELLPKSHQIITHPADNLKFCLNLDDKKDEVIDKKKTAEDPNLKSILDELNNPEFDSPKPNKDFDNERKSNAQYKKKFIIESDDEGNEKESNTRKRRKVKKKKMEQRALHISDDEDDEKEDDEAGEFESEIEEDHEDRIVEYDSEENEVIVQPQLPKKKRKLGEFFEQEAELTSEDEWVGSGDEDEAGLDRMEREAGDDDTFNQNKLQRELGQIHMRDVLDQDKREVRLIQELLFEDGDLGGGSRQRKFRWKNADGDEETGTTVEFTDTQEEEFESEEQWRKQRHEREMFLKSLKNQEETEESINISINRTSIIKANLSKNTADIFSEVNAGLETIEVPIPEKKTATVKDILSPKKPFAIFQQNYHGSLLTRGRGALARLAALAIPLASDDDTVKNTLAPGKRNFVFATVDAQDREQQQFKVSKRKAESNSGTPRLVKKMRTEDKQKIPKSSLLDHLQV